MHLHFPIDRWSLFTALTMVSTACHGRMYPGLLQGQQKAGGKNDCSLQRCRILLCWALSCCTGPATTQKVSKGTLSWAVLVVRVVCHIIRSDYR